jgi:Multicopper oxidase
MHLHGHKFWVLGAGDGMFPYSSVADAPQSMINLSNPPYRDTTELPANGWTVIRYVPNSHDVFSDIFSSRVLVISQTIRAPGSFTATFNGILL